MQSFNKNFLSLGAIIILAGTAVLVFIDKYSILPVPKIPETEIVVSEPRLVTEITKDSDKELVRDSDSEFTQDTNGEVELPQHIVVAENLDVPWDIAFLPSGEMLVTERSGNLLIFVKNSQVEKVSIPGVEHTGEGGLLGLTLDPDFSSNNFLYLYHTLESGEGLINRVVRYEFKDSVLANPQTIIGNIPGARFHDGGRIRFGPDGKLYITTGDAGDSQSAQDLTTLAGKILRIDNDGSVPEDNPFVGLASVIGVRADGKDIRTEIWSYGHRNPQGITWDTEGRLWSTEHGRSGIQSGLDELNLIERGANYGWPESEGDKVLAETKAPALHSGASVTWAPASALYYDGSIFFGGLRGETLFEAILSGDKVVELREHFVGDFGRIRTITLGPDGMIYFTTSNQDGRGRVQQGDDKIIRIHPEIFR